MSVTELGLGCTMNIFCSTNDIYSTRFLDLGYIRLRIIKYIGGLLSTHLINKNSKTKTDRTSRLYSNEAKFIKCILSIFDYL